MRVPFGVLVALLFSCVGMTATEAAADCAGGGLTTVCETVTDQRYRGGGYNPRVVPIQACLPDRLWQSIRLTDGSSAFEAGFYYGRAEPEIVATAHNNACWTRGRNGAQQHGVPGAYAVAFVCCDEYCGWTGGVIPTAGGRVTLSPMVLPAAHDPMWSYRLSSGGYDRRAIIGH